MEVIDNPSRDAGGEPVYRVSMELTGRELECIEALKNGWGLPTRSAAIHRLFDQLFAEDEDEESQDQDKGPVAA